MNKKEEIQESIAKKVVEVREFIRELPEELQYEAAHRIAGEAEILELFSDRPEENVIVTLR